MSTPVTGRRHITGAVPAAHAQAMNPTHGHVTVLDILPEIRQIADGLHQETLTNLERRGTPVRCRPGCTACCHHLVPVSEYEALSLARTIRDLPAAKRSKVVARFTRALGELDASGLLSRLTDTFTNEPGNQSAMLALSMEYWSLSIPCPMLEDDLCSIHAHRPLACRSYFVTSSPDRCRAIYSSAPGPEPVHHSADAGGALAAFSGQGIQSTRVLPLVLTLMAERPLSSRPWPALPADLMKNRFMTLLEDYYTRRPAPLD